MGRKVSRRRQTAKGTWLLSRALGRRAKRVCAAALCVSLTMGGNLVNMAAAASEDEEITDYKLTADMLYSSIRDAVEAGRTVDADGLDIQGQFADDYYELLKGDGETSAPLYELTMPKKFVKKYRNADVGLRVFVRLDEDAMAAALENAGNAGAGGAESLDAAGESDYSAAAEYGYEFTGDEKVIFVLTNDSDERHKASITVNRMTSGVIAVTPESRIDWDENFGDADDMDADAGENQDGSANAGESSAGAENVIVIEPETSAPEANGAAEGTTESEGGNAAIPETDGTDAENAKTEDAGLTEPAETESAPVNESEPQATVAERRSHVVMVSLASDSDAVENDEEDSAGSGQDRGPGFAGGGNSAAVIATSSDAENATSSDAELGSLDGELYNAVLLDGEGAIAYAVNAGKLDLDGMLLASDSDAKHVFVAEDGGVVVRVVADKRALPESAALRVKKLDEASAVNTLDAEDSEDGSEEYTAAKEALEENKVEYDGMMAFDIGFVDVGDVEVEPNPEYGTLKVSMKFKSGALPENADLNTVAVQQVSDEAGGAQVETVADALDKNVGKVKIAASADVALIADFEVDALAKENNVTVTFDELNQRDRTKVKFFVNLKSRIAESDSDYGGDVTLSTNFSGQLYGTQLTEYPDQFKAIQAPANSQGVTSKIVIVGSSTGNAYSVDQEIRSLATGYDNASLDSDKTPFKVQNFPSDEEIFKKMVSGSQWSNLVGDEGIQINGEEIFPSMLTVQNYAIRWYVFKYPETPNMVDGWHIDGIIVPRSGQLVVEKTFALDDGETGNIEKLASDAESSGFELKVEAKSTIAGKGKHSYYLKLKERSDNENSGQPGYKDKIVSVDKRSVTYRWEVDVYDDTYTISESNTDFSDWKWQNATYSKDVAENSGDHDVTNEQFNDSESIICKTAGTDENNDKTQYQEFFITNNYKKAKKDLTIQKAIKDVDEKTIASSEYGDTTFYFEIEAAEGTPDLKPNTVYVVEGKEASATVNEARKLLIPVQGAGTATIQDLPVGTYSVKEVPGTGQTSIPDLKTYYYVNTEYGNGDGQANVTLSAGENGDGTTTVTNIYQKGVSLTVKKLVDGNMGDKEAKFQFTIEVKRFDGTLIDLEGSYEGISVDEDGKFKLGHGQTLVIPNLPATGNGFSYSITENSYAEDGYETAVTIRETPQNVTSDENGTTITGDGVTADTDVVFTNKKDVTTPTGLFTNNRPYILMLLAAFAGLGCAAVLWRRKSIRSREDN